MRIRRGSATGTGNTACLQLSVQHSDEKDHSINLVQQSVDLETRAPQESDFNLVRVRMQALECVSYHAMRLAIISDMYVWFIIGHLRETHRSAAGSHPAAVAVAHPFCATC